MEHGFVARHQIAKARAMREIQCSRSADRYAYAVNGEGIGLADRSKCPVGWTTGAQMAFGVNFEEAIL
jgi:hypothetical protein